MKTGIIADIQRCSLHDGPGLRTTVFFKGCPLRCAWCHNPECIAPEPEILSYPEHCIACGQCDQGCFSGAKVLCGKAYTVDEVLREVMADAPYYGADGGVTLSGGEPLLQHDFAQALAKACCAKGLHVAVETSLAVPWHYAADVLTSCQLIMADLKHAEDAPHCHWTGQDATRIRQNLQRADSLGIPIVLRTPIVPGVNDDPAVIGSIAAFAQSLRHLSYYELLPYHPLGQSKANALAKHSGQRFDIPSPDVMQTLTATAALTLTRPIWIAGKPYHNHLQEAGS